MLNNEVRLFRFDYRIWFKMVHLQETFQKFVKVFPFAAFIHKRYSNALCPVRPQQTTIGRTAGTLPGSAPAPVAVFGVAPLPLKIAQPFMAGTRCPPSSKVPPGTKGACARPSHFLPSLRDFYICLTRYPAMNGWAIIGAIPSAVRCGIFVEPQTKIIFSPGGAAYSLRIPIDVAPDGALEFFNFGFYKYASPDGLRCRKKAASIAGGRSRYF